MRTWRWLFILLICSIFTVSCESNRTNIQITQRENSNSRIGSERNEPYKRLYAPSLKPFMPTHLIIPAIHISSKIKPVGVLSNGQMDVPESTDLVGILHPGVIAGAKGNMVIDGHVDSYTGPAVMFDLKKLNRGDTIIVRDNMNHQLAYKVESVESFLTSEAPIDRIFGETDEVRLNLITCTGTYSRKKKEHQKRLIVFAKLDGEI